jgi:hypothetical protein
LYSVMYTVYSVLLSPLWLKSEPVFVNVEPRNRYRGIDFASLCSLAVAGQYDK